MNFQETVSCLWRNETFQWRWEKWIIKRLTNLKFVSQGVYTFIGETSLYFKKSSHCVLRQELIIKDLKLWMSSTLVILAFQ